MLYLDDILILVTSHEQSIKQSQLAVDLLVCLGFLRCLISPKSCLTPSRTCEFLKMTIDLHRLELRVPCERIQRFRQVVRKSLSLKGHHRLTLCQLAGVIGKIQAMAPAMSLARLWSHHLLFAKNHALASSVSPRTAWNNFVRLSAEIAASSFRSGSTCSSTGTARTSSHPRPATWSQRPALTDPALTELVRPL